MIFYQTNLFDIKVQDLEGFFVNWMNPPNSDNLLKILQNSQFKVLAIEKKLDESKREKLKVVGFVNALSDGVLSVFVPLLEVLPEYQKQNIGIQLMQKMLELTKDFYMLDLVCDPSLVPFYQKLKLKQSVAMSHRNYTKQSGI